VEEVKEVGILHEDLRTTRQRRQRMTMIGRKLDRQAPLEALAVDPKAHRGEGGIIETHQTTEEEATDQSQPMVEHGLDPRNIDPIINRTTNTTQLPPLAATARDLLGRGIIEEGRDLAKGTKTGIEEKSPILGGAFPETR
jgi:hypothetical protein